MSRQHIIDEVMDYFNFEKIHKTMLFLNWTWHNTGVPEIYELRQFVRELLNQLFEENLKEISCGGFHLYRKEDSIVVTFELTYLDIDINENLE